MFCTKCGTRIGKGQIFCANCGERTKNESEVDANAHVRIDTDNALPTERPRNARENSCDDINSQASPPKAPQRQIAPSQAGETFVESQKKSSRFSANTVLLGTIAALLLTLILVLILRPPQRASDYTPLAGEASASEELPGSPEHENGQLLSPGIQEAPAIESHRVSEQPMLPQMDCSTARIPITEAIYEHFTAMYGYGGPAPISSRTHGAWLNLADGKADIIFLVAPTMDELDYFADKGVDIEMKVYGYDGLVFIGNQSNPVGNLTSRQIRDIYSGRIGNWSQLGGTNADIVVYIRNPESGSQRLFESLVWDGYSMPDFSRMGFKQDEIDPNVTQREDSFIEYGDMDEIVVSVLINQYSIGFNIMSYIDNTFDSAALKLFSVDGYMPTTDNFAAGNYPYLTTSYVAIRADEPADSSARQLYDWIGSPESYRIISENSTLTVSFSNSTIIRAGMGYEPPRSEPAWGDANSIGNPDAPIDYLLNIIARLDKQYFTREDLLHFNLDELSYLRNGVYALSGYIFRMDKYLQYFNSISWYHGTISSDSEAAALFNEYQKANMNVILARERELGG